MKRFKPGIYQYYKDKFYLVTGTALLSGTEDNPEPEIYVIYRQLYDRFGQRVRPAREFFGMVVKEGKGTLGPRFKLIWGMTDIVPDNVVQTFRNSLMMVEPKRRELGDVVNALDGAIYVARGVHAGTLQEVFAQLTD